jgi:hypothetical protein
MRRSSLALLAFLAAPSQPATAPFNALFAPITTPAQPTMYVTGEALMKTCAEAEKSLKGAAFDTEAAIECTAYLTGALDQETRMETASGGRAAICVPPTVTKAQLAGAFMDYARSNPDDQDAIATDMVTAALAHAYPCASRLTGQ